MLTSAIGFIGLGIMGLPMAGNLIKAGYTLFVYDINASSVAMLTKLGARACSSPKEVATSADIIICIVPDTPHIREVVFGAEGVAAGIAAGKLFIDMSTIDASTEKEINEWLVKLGADSLDAPVSGGENGAIEASLSIMVGGSKTAFERALPVLEVMGNKVNHMGGIGAGQITKSCNQIATALTTQGIIEAFTLAGSAGIDLVRLREVMLAGFANSRALQISGEKMVRKDFSPGFKLQLYRKDLRIARAVAADASLHLPGTGLLFDEMDSLVSAGKGDLDFSALIQIFDNQNG
ncbi:MAG: NAD(P)-dependent oxidoreductase [Flavipsychrobacter sp.]|nr:NAD(P)-dependent oxidoreductase [Flavipsychrobacter sp.]